ncbi:MAG TPA: hypothetical protein VD790_02090 [Thermoleophilaceae bacterium]|nr:hypothetical protein [Thermoleophilaceae bacterium]
MARRSLKPQLNQIRTWVRQGRTDAWIAHQLEVGVRDISAFKREHGLATEGDEEAFSEELDLRAEDDALIAAELDAEPEEDEAEAEEDEEAAEKTDGEGDAAAGDRPRRRRGRRGGRGRRRAPKKLEGSFDHGEEGYGLWLDPSIQEDSVYAEHWAGHRPVTVTVEPDRIVIRRAGEDGADESSADESSADEAGSDSDRLDPDEFAA